MYYSTQNKQERKSNNNNTFCSYVSRWQSDPRCVDMPFPKKFTEVKRTLEDIRKARYGKAPTNGKEILQEFSKPEVFQNLGLSLHREHGVFFNKVDISEHFENCIFSSSKSISLILENTKKEDRCFLMDATFRSSPKGIFQQVLLLHVQFGTKVNAF